MAAERGNSDVVWVDVLPSFKRFRGTLRRELTGASDQAGRDSGRAYGDAFEKAAADRVQKASTALAAAKQKLETSSLRVEQAQRREADAAGKASVAQTRLTELTEKGRASATQLATAHESLAAAQRVQAQRAQETAIAQRRNADATDDHVRATRQLAEVQGQTTTSSGRLSAAFARLGGDSRGASSGMRDLKRAGDGVAATLSGLRGLTKFSFAALGTQAAAGGFIMLAAAAAPAIGVLSLLPAVVAAAAAPLGALAVGLLGVGDAFKAQIAFGQQGSSATRSAATAQESAARQVESAQKGLVAAGRQVESAQRGVATSLEQVGDAERDYADAQKATRVAQLALNDARATALRQLADLNRELSTSSLDEEDAVLAVERAQERLTEAVALNRDENSLDRREANLAYRQAVARLEDVRTRNARLAEDTAAANEAGVEGSETVVAAKERVADAVQSETDAQRGLRDAQQGVTDAQRDLMDAQAGVADAQRDVARAIAGVATAAAATSPAADELARTMSELSPSARAVVSQIMGLKPAFDAARLDVQEQLFAGLGSRIDALASTYLPVLRTALGGLATDLNGGAKAVADFFLLPGTTSDWVTILANGRMAFQQLGGALLPILSIFTDLSEVGSAFLPQLAGGLAGIVGGWADMVAKARESGSLAGYMQNALDVAGQLGDVIGNIGSIIGSVFSAGKGGALSALQDVTGEVADFLNSTAGSTGLTGFFDAASQSISSLVPLVSTLGAVFTVVGPALAGFATDLAPTVNLVFQAMVSVVKQIAPILPQLATAVTAVVMAFMPLVPVLADLVTSFLPPLLSVLTAIAPLLPALVVGVVGVVGAVRTVTTVMGAWNAVMNANPFVLIAGLVIGLVGYLVTLYQTSDTFREKVDTAFRVIGAAATWMWDNAIGPVFGWLKTGWEYLVTGISWYWENVLSPVFSALGTAVGWTWNNILSPLFGAIGDAWSGLATGFQWTWNNVLSPVFSWFGDTLTTIKDGFTTAVDWIGRTWSGLKDTLMAPVQWVIDFVWNDGLRSLWNTINNLWDGDDLPVFQLASGGVLPAAGGGSTGGGTTRRLATGGVLPGYTPGRDVHTFISSTGGRLELSGGEAVMRPEFTAALGVPTINLLNRLAAQEGAAGVARVLAMPRTAEARRGDPPSPQAFASGGILNLPGWLDTALDFVPGAGGVTDIIDAINGGTGFGAGAWGDALVGTVEKAGSQLWDAASGLFGGGDSISGAKPIDAGAAGSGFAAALAWARAQEGKPYIWGGVGPAGYDCSGFMSAITNVIRGRSPYSRVGVTGSFPWAGFGPGEGAFTIGSSKNTGSGIGHMAGTLLGVNVESRGSDGVVVGPRARGASNPLFTTRAALGFRYGGLVPGDRWADGIDSIPAMLTPDERVLTADTDAILQQQLRDIRIDGRDGDTPVVVVRNQFGTKTFDELIDTRVEVLSGDAADEMRAELAAAGLI